VIQSFRHAGLEKFFYTGTRAGIQPAHAEKLSIRLTVLNVARNADAMNAPGWDLHPPKGPLSGHWAVKVSANWRLTFTFENENAILVDYHD
jgi:proteic killer suppression protein